MRILNIKNIIAFVFAWTPKTNESITTYVSYAIRDPSGKYKKSILIKLGFIAYAKPASPCAMILLHKPRYVFYPPIDLQSNQGMGTIYLGDYDIPPSELGPESLNRTLDTCKELARNLKSHIEEIEYIDWDSAYSLEEGDKELFEKYVCVVKDDKSERSSLTTEWNSNHHDYLVPSELIKDASEQSNLVDTSLHHSDEKVGGGTEINETEGSSGPIEVHDSFAQAAQWIIQNYSDINEHYGITVSMTLERAAKAFLDTDRNKPDLVESVTDLLFQGCIFLKELARKNNRDEPELSNMVCAMATIKGGIFGNQTHFGHLYFVRPENDEIYGEADGYNKGHMCDTCEYKNERANGKCKYDDFAKENLLFIKNCDNCMLYRETMKFLDATKRLDVPNRLKYLLTNSNIAQITK